MLNFEELNVISSLCEEKIELLKKGDEDEFKVSLKFYRELLAKVREERDEFIPLLPKDY